MPEKEKIEPLIIQGGMGVGVSNWRLAKSVALAGEKLGIPVLGVVSGTGVEELLARRLQDGDPEGDIRRALEAFPSPKIAERILNQYFQNSTKHGSSRYRLTPKLTDLLSNDPAAALPIIELSMVANFVEVFLAKEGHDGPIGINYLEKIQLLHLPRMYGAMLAGVDVVLEGAGIPDQVPKALDDLAAGSEATYRVDVLGRPEGLELKFNPSQFLKSEKLTRPKFFAVIASNILARVLTDRVKGVNGFVIERPTAGGHNAPPRIK